MLGHPRVHKFMTLGSLDQKVALFLSDRPYNCLKKDGQTLRTSDQLTQAQARGIVAAEKALADKKCNFLSRVSFETKEYMDQASQVMCQARVLELCKARL